MNYLSATFGACAALSMLVAVFAKSGKRKALASAAAVVFALGLLFSLGV